MDPAARAAAVVAELRRGSSAAADRAGLARFGIDASKAPGVQHPRLEGGRRPR